MGGVGEWLDKRGVWETGTVLDPFRHWLRREGGSRWLVEGIRWTHAAVIMTRRRNKGPIILQALLVWLALVQ